jgi:peptide/nickel transport system substrate-binding protein
VERIIVRILPAGATFLTRRTRTGRAANAQFMLGQFGRKPREDLVTLRILFAAFAIMFASGGGTPATAQVSGGTLRVYNSTNPPSASILEEVTIATVMPFMAVFNNLVLFDQAKSRNSIDGIVPELAESWSLDESKTRLTFKLRQGVSWHDGNPFTAKDVQCTWHRLIGKQEDFRKSPRRIWYSNLAEVAVDNDYQVTFQLKKPQPALISLLASGLAPVYPCHVASKDMRTNPIGTGPFKFVEFKSNVSIKLVRNPNYWKPGRPYLDSIEWSIISSRATRILAFAAREFDLTFVGDVTVPIARDLASQAPNTVCKLVPTNVTTNLIVNRDMAPFNDPNVRRAMMLGLDREGFIKIISEGKGRISGAMMPAPEGNWGMPAEMLQELPGYAADLTARQAEARKIMQGLGYGPRNRLKVRVSTRDFQAYRDPAGILVDQLNRIYFDAELEVIESSVWFGRMVRKNYAVGLNLTGAGVDDPDVMLKENYACDSENNFTKYCNPEVEKLLDQQSQEADESKRKKVVWEIERKLAEDVANPVISHNVANTCWHPHVRGHAQHDNSIYNNWRFEEVWIDK